ncbi:MAG: hypothetical protein RL728_1161, partial [Bacteroidota bacterium]
MKTILFICTSHNVFNGTDKKTGYWVSEIAHPYEILSKKYKIVFASPKGGLVPVDPGSLAACENDASVQSFLNDKDVQEKLANSVTLESIQNNDYDAVFYPGGHGLVYDLYSDAISHKIAARHFEAKKPVGALCHGPAAIVAIKLSNGTFLVKDRRVTGFSNTEEQLAHLDSIVPYLLEDELKKNGGIYSKAA